ncbi:hypothetical protein DFJ73DRAFT_536841 [Zopfochytrium polystomum]|nr:hypothetical protein DFJ73DRAFT_536841 [Zopfochytrium polystomum]
MDRSLTPSFVRSISAIDRWFEDLSYYEKTLEQMAHAKLDDNFREELKAIEQWFSVLSDPERTTALYSLLQHTTPVQVRFLITVLQQMSQKDGGAGGTAPSPIVGSAPGSSKPMMGVGKDDDKYLSAGMLPLGSGDTANAGTRARRLYDRHSAPTGEEVKRTDDVISSANWSVASPTSSTGPGLRVYPHAVLTHGQNLRVPFPRFS